MKKDDIIRICHMMDALKEALSFTEGKKRADLMNDRMLVLSVVKCIEIIGEAASKVTLETKNQSPQIPWNEIIAMRNRLIHVYYDIDIDRVWDTVIGDLPGLQTLLGSILEQEGLNLKNDLFSAH